jgi:hypothetical protein
MRGISCDLSIVLAFQTVQSNCTLAWVWNGNEDGRIRLPPKGLLTTT